jgi:hypothetical protein
LTGLGSPHGIRRRTSGVPALHVGAPRHRRWAEVALRPGAGKRVRRMNDQQASQGESGTGIEEVREAGFVPLPMRQPRLRGGNPPPEPPDRGDDEASAPLE